MPYVINVTRHDGKRWRHFFKTDVTSLNDMEQAQEVYDKLKESFSGEEFKVDIDFQQTTGVNQTRSFERMRLAKLPQPTAPLSDVSTRYQEQILLANGWQKVGPDAESIHWEHSELPAQHFTLAEAYAQLTSHP